MKLEHIDAHTIKVTFRQSSLNTLLMCPERARRDMVADVHEDDTNEDAAVGTCLHAGVEAIIKGECTWSGGMVVAMQALHGLYEAGHFEWDRLSFEHARKYYTWWFKQFNTQICEPRELRERYEAGLVLLEYPFEFHSHNLNYGSRTVEVWFGGRIDCIDLGNLVTTDWKTAGRTYNEAERERWAVQPIVYSEAVARNFGHRPKFEYVVFPKVFTAKPLQVFGFTPKPKAFGWVASMVDPIVDMLLSDMVSWPLNDQHWLCSKKWCPHWDTCKGMFIN